MRRLRRLRGRRSSRCRPRCVEPGLGRREHDAARSTTCDVPVALAGECRRRAGDRAAALARRVDLGRIADHEASAGRPGPKCRRSRCADRGASRCAPASCICSSCCLRDIVASSPSSSRWRAAGEIEAEVDRRLRNPARPWSRGRLPGRSWESTAPCTSAMPATIDHDLPAGKIEHQSFAGLAPPSDALRWSVRLDRADLHVGARARSRPRSSSTLVTLPISPPPVTTVSPFFTPPIGVLMLLHPLLLRTDHQEIEDHEDEDEREQRDDRAGGASALCRACGLLHMLG